MDGESGELTGNGWGWPGRRTRTLTPETSWGVPTETISCTYVARWFGCTCNLSRLERENPSKDFRRRISSKQMKEKIETRHSARYWRVTLLLTLLLWTLLSNGRRYQHGGYRRCQWLLHRPRVNHQLLLITTAVSGTVRLIVYFVNYFVCGKSAKYCDQRVCLSVCLSDRMSPKPHVHTSKCFLYMLRVSVSWSCSDDTAMYFRFSGWRHDVTIAQMQIRAVTN